MFLFFPANCSCDLLTDYSKFMLIPLFLLLVPYLPHLIIKENFQFLRIFDVKLLNRHRNCSIGFIIVKIKKKKTSISCLLYLYNNRLRGKINPTLSSNFFRPTGNDWLFMDKSIYTNSFSSSRSSFSKRGKSPLARDLQERINDILNVSSIAAVASIYF